MKDLWQDIRYGVRTIGRQPAFVAVIVLTLALGIGANTAIFSVVYGVLLRPLPYPEPDRIIQLSISYKGQLDYSGFTAREYAFWKDHSEPLEYLAATTPAGFNLSGADRPLRVSALRVSSDYFRVMGVLPVFGREFSPDEDSLKGPSVAILSYGLWKSQFGATPVWSAGQSRSMARGTPSLESCQRDFKRIQWWIRWLRCDASEFGEKSPYPGKAN